MDKSLMDSIGNDSPDDDCSSTAIKEEEQEENDQLDKIEEDSLEDSNSNDFSEINQEEDNSNCHQPAIRTGAPLELCNKCMTPMREYFRKKTTKNGERRLYPCWRCPARGCQTTKCLTSASHPLPTMVPPQRRIADLDDHFTEQHQITPRKRPLTNGSPLINGSPLLLTNGSPLINGPPLINGSPSLESVLAASTNNCFDETPSMINTKPVQPVINPMPEGSAVNRDTSLYQMYRRILIQNQQTPSLARMRQKQLDVLQLQQKELEKRLEVLEIWKAVGLRLLNDPTPMDRMAEMMAVFAAEP